MVRSAAVGKVCIIGAGSSGIAACQVLNARGIDFDCYETGSEVGGNWRYDNDNGMSSAYRSLFINTSREMMQYAAYPIPEDYPDYPHHSRSPATSTTMSTTSDYAPASAFTPRSPPSSPRATGAGA